jgi:hypothetical protein
MRRGVEKGGWRETLKPDGRSTIGDMKRSYRTKLEQTRTRAATTNYTMNDEDELGQVKW